MPQGRRGGAVWARWAVLSRRTHPLCRRSWSHWSERRSGWCCSPCCRSRYSWRYGRNGQTDAHPFLPRRTVQHLAVSAWWLSVLFLPRRGGRRLLWALSLWHRAGIRWAVQLRMAHAALEHPVPPVGCRLAAHNCGNAGFRAVRSFSGSAGAVHRPGQCSSRRCWYNSAGWMPGTNFPAGYWPAQWSFAGRSCGRYTCHLELGPRHSWYCHGRHYAAHQPGTSRRRFVYR